MKRVLEMLHVLVISERVSDLLVSAIVGDHLCSASEFASVRERFVPYSSCSNGCSKISLPRTTLLLWDGGLHSRDRSNLRHCGCLFNSDSAHACTWRRTRAEQPQQILVLVRESWNLKLFAICPCQVAI